jgi:hypothetical protein
MSIGRIKHADVHVAPDSADVNLGDAIFDVDNLDDLAGDGQTHD